MSIKRFAVGAIVASAAAPAFGAIPATAAIPLQPAPAVPNIQVPQQISSLPSTLSAGNGSFGGRPFDCTGAPVPWCY